VRSEAKGWRFGVPSSLGISLQMTPSRLVPGTLRAALLMAALSKVVLSIGCCQSPLIASAHYDSPAIVTTACRADPNSASTHVTPVELPPGTSAEVLVDARELFSGCLDNGQRLLLRAGRQYHFQPPGFGRVERFVPPGNPERGVDRSVRLLEPCSDGRHATPRRACIC
jgi:hypothetical protein